MLGLNYKLEDLEKRGQAIYTAIIGAGQMGRGMTSQMILMKGMTPSIVVDINLDNAKKAFLNAGIPEKDILIATNQEEADEWMKKKKYVAASDSHFATQSKVIQAVIEATGITEVGAEIALDTILNKKHIVMLNAETDAVVGPILKKFADNAGVVFTGAAGDEPGAVKELYDFAIAAGFEVRVVGKGKNNKVDLDCNPDTVKEEAVRRGVSPHMLAAFKEGSKTMVEMALMSNSTGCVPDIRGAHGISGQVNDLPKILSLKEEGGVLNKYGVVEYVDGIAPGVFLIVTSKLPEVRNEMEYLSMGKGPNYILYRPYHLCSLETPLSAAKAVLDHQATIAPLAGLVSEVVTVAKKDLKAGEKLDGIGGYTVYGTIEKADIASKLGAIPVGLINTDTVLTKDVKKGDIITYDMVEFKRETTLMQLRKMQDKIF
ncbi:MAG: SAF domain-containing protein [Clostridium sp.]|uniref:NAD(P)H-dependent oxidoreductase n=1 Tax=Clostridium sp. TaxID=1506 RepID=UPI0025C580C4|nr:SAF domain-containing protein [Clostridium sp.]MCH3965776.1 SAF domain-containing protein [Clostridium sp.]MCI1717185.1 SAF domain-containing protein [Clostridium sp.]MCI1801525.1 SAF domain-containing protein [Clostridium sp.]MCI1815344.1 SAF domain-containing protein [Clostridium sp.]MCI1872247.1 SAF domain-containing protein [Clostridium sp.]